MNYWLSLIKLEEDYPIGKTIHYFPDSMDGEIVGHKMLLGIRYPNNELFLIQFIEINFGEYGTQLMIANDTLEVI